MARTSTTIPIAAVATVLAVAGSAQALHLVLGGLPAQASLDASGVDVIVAPVDMTVSVDVAAEEAATDPFALLVVHAGLQGVVRGEVDGDGVDVDAPLAPGLDAALDQALSLEALEGILVPEPAPEPAPARPRPLAPGAPVAVASAAAPAPGPVDVPPEMGAAVLAATAAAAVGWASGAWAALGKRLLGIVGLAGFTRLAKDGLLDHEARDQLYALVRERPGASMNDLVSQSGAARNTVTYHLRVLEREGLVTSTREGRRRLYFPTGTGAKPDAAAFAAVAHATSRSIAERVRAEPGLDQRTLCASLALPPSLAHWHVDRLEHAGVVKRVREGRHVRYFPGPAADRVLA